MNKNKNMPMSLAEQTAMLENYNKVRGERDAKEAEERKARKLAKKNGLKYNSGPEKKPVCAYCNEDHWMKNDGKVVCPTLCAKNLKNLVARNQGAKKDRLWQNQVSEEMVGKSGGWETVVKGLKKNVGLKEKACVMVPKNGFDTLAEEEDRMEATREKEEVAWELAKEEEEKKAADKKNSGVWGSVKESHDRVLKWLPPPQWTPKRQLVHGRPQSAPQLEGGSVEKPQLIRAMRKTDEKSEPYKGEGRRPKSPVSPPIPLGSWDSLDH